MKNDEENIHCGKGGADQHFSGWGMRQRVSKFTMIMTMAMAMAMRSIMFFFDPTQANAVYFYFMPWYRPC